MRFYNKIKINIHFLVETLAVSGRFKFRSCEDIVIAWFFLILFCKASLISGVIDPATEILLLIVSFYCDLQNDRT